MTYLGTLVFLLRLLALLLVHDEAFHSLVDQINLFHLVDQLLKLVVGPILVELTAVDIVATRAIGPRTAKDKELACVLVITHGLCPSGLWTPASLADSSPHLSLKVVDHDVIKTCRLDLVVDGIVNAVSVNLVRV